MPEMTPEEFRELRQRLGLSQEKMARRLDVGLNSVQRWEGGTRKISGPVAILMRMLVAQHEGEAKAA